MNVWICVQMIVYENTKTEIRFLLFYLHIFLLATRNRQTRIKPVNSCFSFIKPNNLYDDEIESILIANVVSNFGFAAVE